MINLFPSFRPSILIIFTWGFTSVIFFDSSLVRAESVNFSPTEILEVRIDKIQEELEKIESKFTDYKYLSNQKRINFYQETYDQLEILQQKYIEIVQEMPANFQQKEQFTQIDKTIQTSFQESLALLTEITSFNQETFKELERQLKAKGYTDKKIEELEFFPLRNSTMQFLITTKIKTLINNFKELDDTFNTFYLTYQPINNSLNTYNPMSSLLTFLALLIIILSLVLIVFSIFKILWQKRTEKSHKLERRINHLSEKVRTLNNKLEIQDKYLSTIAENIRDHIAATNKMIQELQKDQDNKYIDKREYYQELTNLKGIISENFSSIVKHEEIEINPEENNPNMKLKLDKNEIPRKFKDHYLSEYLDIYNQNPENILHYDDLIYYEVLEGKESESQRLTTKLPEIILEEPITGAGIFWILKFPEIDQFYLFPKNLEISEAKSYTIKDIFEGYQLGYHQSFRLVKPGLVAQVETKKWKLIEKGIIRGF